MRSKRQVTSTMLLSLITLICFIAIASTLQTQWITNFDKVVIRWVQGWESAPLTCIMKFFTQIGSSPAVILISFSTIFILYKYLHHRAELILFGVLLIGTVCLNQILKMIFHRERPSLHRLISETGFSFPSGHSMEAFTLYAAIAFLLWRHIPTRTGRTVVIVACIGMVLMIGISRIYLGVHYPSDVMGAYLASGFWYGFTIWFYQWYMEYRYFKQTA
ncbi:phosphatase PAP2 family protein [Paenibacillus hexagrammi]|uniref:Phosphatase PAP2 family protein n=1 Tax=Paenibacillus hexagrammi TaxID=2908839 RepID=A0ABY3SP05_9BACL|nr:phosphatase PAP2 family protein [Paenibacillus sp. YPD9-1]UJF35681.1 phosphatase PAP2 family protein [Paenibacillus sp. YPD9-1]